MKKSLLFESIDKAFELFHKKGFSINETRSIFLKLFLLRKHGLISINDFKNNDFRIKGLIESKCVISSRFLNKMEKFHVSDKPISANLIEDLFKVMNNLTDKQFFLLLDTDKARKNKGQYFTSPEIVSKIYLSLLPERQVCENIVTLVDFSVGLGEFVKPLINDTQFRYYAVELDPISFEFLLFDLIWNQEIEYSQKAKALLTILQGDSLLGYQESSFEKLKATKNGSQLLKNLIQIRKEILESTDKVSLASITTYFELKDLIAKHHESLIEFNWFVDFPEIFFDAKLTKLKHDGFDFVVGNPPWVGFQAINHAKYRSLFSNKFFSNELYGKFNFSLPFMILAHELSKLGGGVVIPRGILSETYAQIWRERIIQDGSLFKITLLQKQWFDNVLNEFCIVYWDKKDRGNFVEIIDEENQQEMKINHESIKSPLFRIPLIPHDIYEEIEHIYDLSVELHEVCDIRRGLTLSRKYQEQYFQIKKKTADGNPIKKLIRHNKNTSKYKEGVFNFQIHYSGEEFVYDKSLLGAPGSSELFEQPKIIRRNRGKQWIIGLDIEGSFYVNDIFDVIIPKPDVCDAKILFGCLCSSIFQFIAENHLQRDITSNFVRRLPYPKLSDKDNKEIKNAVDSWLTSPKSKEDIISLRKKTDQVINNHYQLSKNTLAMLENNLKLHWID
ncbi:MAG: N-6 DNA methylase [Candidatus Heimdallarchaeota archaeon]|nr:N-6 DNA methylase [Candidatus Heimdallarchaeota archaeon]MCK4878540.1 N-6 DNA methylase [Candidatus Heimdallarchaeota archaeon]